jgi:hypothetical protein
MASRQQNRAWRAEFRTLRIRQVSDSEMCLDLGRRKLQEARRAAGVTKRDFEPEEIAHE